MRSNENIINLYGDFLSKLINKSPVACKGLIRFSINRYLASHDYPEDKNILFEEFIEIVSSSIKEQLINAHFVEVDQIIEKLLNQVTIQKAIFSMSV